jgi:hypothetical protein
MKINKNLLLIGGAGAAAGYLMGKTRLIPMLIGAGAAIALATYVDMATWNKFMEKAAGKVSVTKENTGG